MGLPGGNAAHGEPGTKFCAEIFAESAVAGIFVSGHATTGDEVFEAFVTSGFASVERMCGVGFGGVFGRFD